MYLLVQGFKPSPNQLSNTWEKKKEPKKKKRTATNWKASWPTISRSYCYWTDKYSIIKIWKQVVRRSNAGWIRPVRIFTHFTSTTSCWNTQRVNSDHSRAATTDWIIDTQRDIKEGHTKQICTIWAHNTLKQKRSLTALLSPRIYH